MANEIPTKIVINCSTGVREVLELTSAELTEREEMRIESEKAQAAKDKIEKATAAKKLSGRSKLLALGLTEAEVTALVG